MEDVHSLSLHISSMTWSRSHASRTERSLGPFDLGTEGRQRGRTPPAAGASALLPVPHPHSLSKMCF